MMTETCGVSNGREKVPMLRLEPVGRDAVRGQRQSAGVVVQCNGFRGYRSATAANIAGDPPALRPAEGRGVIERDVGGNGPGRLVDRDHHRLSGINAVCAGVYRG